MTVNKHWMTKTPETKDLVNDLNCSEILARLLANRGITTAGEAYEFLNPSRKQFHSPVLLTDMEPAVRRLGKARADHESVLVFADRDMDGVTGCAILLKTFERLGIDANYFIPGKWDGYGVSEKGIKKAIDEDIDLLITVDCGTKGHGPLQLAQENGIDVIVTDHHEVGETAPEVLALVNPKRPDSDYPNRDLSGGTVAFKLAQALIEAETPELRHQFEQFALPLSAISTLGDYMELNLENRAIARLGFEGLMDCGLPGLKETDRFCEVEEIRDLAWSLIPLLNSAQEDEAGDLMLNLILADDREQIDRIHQRLTSYKKKRKQRRREQEKHLNDCFKDQVDPDTLLYIIGVDQYVGGLPRVRLSEEYGRPIITYRENGNGTIKGGGRSSVELDFIELFQAAEDLLEDYWGHPGAAGFKLKPDNLEPFKSRLTQIFHENYTKQDFQPTLEIDMELTLNQITPDLVDEIKKIEPFGHGNDEPLFLIRNVGFEELRQFGDGDTHRKFTLKGNPKIEVIDWGGHHTEDLLLEQSYDVVGSLSISDFNPKKVTVSIEDCRLENREEINKCV